MSASDVSKPSPPDLRGDCGRCCGLCCVVHPFDAEQGFGFDKGAHVACQNLSAKFRCRIHDRLSRDGFPSCAGYDCFGAGQRVTQELFGGKSWRDLGGDAPRMFAAFERVRLVHEMLAIVDLAMLHATPAGSERLRSHFDSLALMCEPQAVLDPTVPPTALRAQTLRLVREVCRPIRLTR